MLTSAILTANILPIDGLNGGPYVSSFTLESDQPYMEARTWSQKLVRTVRAGHLWKLTLKFNPMTKIEFSLLDGFLKAKQAAGSSFKVPVGTVETSTPLTASLDSDAVTVRDTSLTFTGHDISGYAGQEFVNFVETQKLYQVLYIEGTTMKIFPGVQEAAAQLTLVNPEAHPFDRPYMMAVFTGNLSYSLNSELLYEVTLSLEESI